jgi:hypothetical protein
MSESEDIVDDPIDTMEKPVLKRQYKMTAEARESRIKNLALGREKLKAKREKLQAKKKSRIVVHEQEESSDSSSSDDDDEYIIKKKNHTKTKQKGGSSLEALQHEILNLKKMLKNKKVVNKTIVQMPQLEKSETRDDDKAEAVRKRIIRMY